MNKIRYIKPDAFFNGEFFFHDVVVQFSKLDGFISCIPLNRIKQDILQQIEYQDGVLCLGLTNAHFHSEFSFLKGCFSKNTGMRGFIQQMIEKRNSKTTQNDKSEAIAWSILDNQGVYQVVNILNGSIFPEIFRYFSGVSLQCMELYAPKYEQIQLMINHAREFKKRHSEENLIIALGLHSPYSSVTEFWTQLAQNSLSNSALSIHFLESLEERQMFDHQNEASYFIFPKSNPIDFLKSQFQQHSSFLLVHNLFISKEEVDAIATAFPNSFFVLCPQSNQFIHNQCPNLDLFAPYSGRILLGTDSLASNDDLNLVKEAYSLKERFPKYPPQFWFKILSSNGNDFFKNVWNNHGFNYKNKGLTIIKNLSPNYELTSESYSVKL